MAAFVNREKQKAVLARVREAGKRAWLPLAVLLAGVLLMLAPAGDQSPEEPPAAMPQEDLERRLETVLSQVEGAGQVRVLLTLDRGIRHTYQTDLQEKQQTEYRERELETVRLSGRDGGDTPVLISSEYPVYRGAVVLCQGADRAAVKLEIVGAVSSATGLRSDRISVIKMSDN